MEGSPQILTKDMAEYKSISKNTQNTVKHLYDVPFYQRFSSPQRSKCLVPAKFRIDYLSIAFIFITFSSQ